MSPKIQSLFPLTVLLALPLLTAGCGAQAEANDEASQEARAEKRAMRVVDLVLGRVDATEAQKSAVAQMVKDLIPRARALKASHKKVRDQLHAQWEKTNPDRAAVHRLVDQQAAQIQALAHEVADRFLELHALLTPKQRKELQQMAEKIHGKARGRHHRWMHDDSSLLDD